VHNADGAGGLVTVRYGDVTDLLLFEGATPRPATVELRSDARLAFARRVGPGWRGAGLVDGKELSLERIFHLTAGCKLKYAYADLVQHCLRITADQKCDFDLVAESGIDRVEVNDQVCRVPATGHLKYQDRAWIPVISREETARASRIHR
ncbi:MAG TPA: hypothetical protein VI756_22920, partial [Blastocatellia bacterium]